jgi:hypothetical protein
MLREMARWVRNRPLILVTPLPQFVQARVAHVNCVDDGEDLGRKGGSDHIGSLKCRTHEVTVRRQTIPCIHNYELRRCLYNTVVESDSETIQSRGRIAPFPQY